MTEPDEVVVVCARITTPLYIPDNKIGKCSECGWKVQFRPHAPKGRRMCVVCAAALIEDRDDIKDDLLTYFRKKQQ